MAPSTLSYADRAKKAQKIRSPIENTVHAVSVSMPVSSATTSPFSSNDSSASSSMGSSGTVISSNSTDVDAADTTAPTTSNSSVILESDGEGSGEQKEQAVKEKEEARSVRKPAVVNVWQQRMADANQPGGTNKRELTPSKVTLKPEASSSPAAVVEEDDAFIVKVRPAPTSWSSRPPLVSPSWSSGTTKPSAEKPVSLDLKDPQSWPEVGLGSPNKAKGKGKSGDDEHQTLKETESPPRSIKTKSKSKWVAIPAQELQAAADAAGISSRRQQHAKSHSASQSSVHSESQSHSRNQSHSRESSLSRPPVGQTIPKVFRTGSKSVSRAGTASGPHSRMHSRSASTHASPAACREVGLPPQETEEQNLVAPRSSSAATPASSLSTESTLPISTYIIPSPASPLPSVFPVQIQQQQQQFKANTGLPSGAVSVFESQPDCLPNGHFITPDSNPIVVESYPSPSSGMNSPHPQSHHTSSSHSPSMAPSSMMMPYAAPYPFYSPYEYPSHPGMTHQMYWASPNGSHQTPNYGPSQQPTQQYMMPYGLPPPSPYGQPAHNLNYFSDPHSLPHHHRQFTYAPMPIPMSAEDVAMVRPKVVFGSFDGEATMSGSRPPFSVGIGPGEDDPSRRRSRKSKRTSWHKTAGVMMLDGDAEVVDLTEKVVNGSLVSGEGEGLVLGMGRRWTFGGFGGDDDGSEMDEEETAERRPNLDFDIVQPIPPPPSLSSAYLPVGGVPIPVPPIPLSSMSSLPPIHTHFPNPIPHPSLSSHLGPFSAETGPSISPIIAMNDSTDLRGQDRAEGGNSMDAVQEGFQTRGDGVEGDGSEWEVRDFGYGFGREGKAGTFRTREGSAVEQLQQPMNGTGGSAYYGNGNGRPRRGSYSYNNPYAYGERGGYSPRRGRAYGRGRGHRRGVHGAYGYDNRERDRDSFATSPLRGPRGENSPHQHQQLFPPGPPTPPSQFQSLPMSHSVEHGGLHTYIHIPYDSAPQSYPMMDGIPQPQPQQQTPFAFDPTIQSLLNQLEYYLSPQNMAQDLFLRKQMDSQGWIPISLIASFNRVRHITTDQGFVRHVLNMSSMIEVKEDMVRMKDGQWQGFLFPETQSTHVNSIYEFPGAPSVDDSSAKVRRSYVEQAVMRNASRDPTQNEGVVGDADTEEETEIDEEEDEEDEEEVVFVMGQESGLWSPEASRS